ncbi:MAG: GNAT family N-acetyltransferase [Marivibrio sp.]|uniref:GNAT family N-acetyltransferase n=1 Tax=Marivibrio sp. TaxID=2039719 RepID=UPI0032ECD8B8
MPDPTIRTVAAPDFDAWRPLYLGYGDFYKVAMSDETLARVWGWLTDPDHVLEGLVAEDADGRLVGLAHFRAMPSPLRAIEVGFLDDLFVDPAARGGKVGEAFFARLEEICRERGWPKMRWITGDDNYRARTLYDRIGVKTSWNLYELTADA